MVYFISFQNYVVPCGESFKYQSFYKRHLESLSHRVLLLLKRRVCGNSTTVQRLASAL